MLILWKHLNAAELGGYKYCARQISSVEGYTKGEPHGSPFVMCSHCKRLPPPLRGSPPSRRKPWRSKSFSKKSPKPLYKSHFIAYNSTNDCDREDSEQKSRQRGTAMGWKRSWGQRRLCARKLEQGSPCGCVSVPGEIHVTDQ